MKFIVKNQDDFSFGLMIAALIVLWFAFVAFAPETEHAPETETWLASQDAQPSSGMEW